MPLFRWITGRGKVLLMPCKDSKRFSYWAFKYKTEPLYNFVCSSLLCCSTFTTSKIEFSDQSFWTKIDLTTRYPLK